MKLGRGVEGGVFDLKATGGISLERLWCSFRTIEHKKAISKKKEPWRAEGMWEEKLDGKNLPASDSLTGRRGVKVEARKEEIENISQGKRRRPMPVSVPDLHKATRKGEGS